MENEKEKENSEVLEGKEIKEDPKLSDDNKEEKQENNQEDKKEDKQEKKKEKKKKLNKRQERFCQLYAGDREFFMNGAWSYAEAYNKPMNTKKENDVCRAGAYENLTKPHILERIDEILGEMGLNDSFADKQLARLMQQDIDFKSKLGAIKEYNNLKSRIVKKEEHKVAIVSLADLHKENEIDMIIGKI